MFVVWMIGRTSGGKAKNGMTYSQARRHDCMIVGYLRPQRAVFKVLKRLLRGLQVAAA